MTTGSATGGTGAAAEGEAAGITAEGFREFCRGLGARALGWPELGAAAESLEGGERMRQLLEAIARNYGSASPYPRCPLCGVITVVGAGAPFHEDGCDFSRFLVELQLGRRAAALEEKRGGRRAPPNAEAIVLEYSKQIDGLFDACNRTPPPAVGGPNAAAPEFPSAEWLWRLHAASMLRRNWTVTDSAGLQVDGPTQQEAFKPMRDALFQRAPAPSRAAGEALKAIARRADETVAGLVEALGRAKLACHPTCRRNSHLTSDCPSTHFVKRPCACECDCPAGPHNAAIDAAVAKVPKRLSDLGAPGPRGGAVDAVAVG